MALENARLFDETNARAAELAIINSVQQGLASKLDMQSMYELVGDKIQEIFDAQVVAIARYDSVAEETHYPYIIERGVRLPDVTTPFGVMTREVMRAGQALLIPDLAAWSEEHGVPMAAPQGEIALSAVYVPLVAGDEVFGALSLQNVDRVGAFSYADARLLTTLAGGLSVALENARLFDETKRLLLETNERAAELAIINSVQQGLAEKLDMQSMYDLVGDKLHEIFDPQASITIALYDHKNERLEFAYAIERGQRLPPMPASQYGVLTRLVAGRTTPLVMDDYIVWMTEHGAEVNVTGEIPKSMMQIPLLAGGQPFGRISVENMDKYGAFGESDVRLLTTLAGSLSVALENARLFDETTERAAELAIINSVQQGLAAKLDMASMYELVGEKIAEIFDASTMSILTWDLDRDVTTLEFGMERGIRDDAGEIGTVSLLARYVIDQGKSVLVNSDTSAWMVEHGLTANVLGDYPKAMLFAPLVLDGKVRGALSLQNVDRENAFSTNDERLLNTLAGSLSVALENARLFDETQRLLTETNERAAELAIINSVQEGLAARLDMQAMYDLVGDKIGEIFDVNGVDIESYDKASNTVFFKYSVERGERLPTDPMPLMGFRQQVVETRAPLLINHDLEARAAQAGQPAIVAGELAKSALWVPLINGNEVTGIVLIENLEREGAFTDRDVGLLITLASSLSVALENARLFDETQRLLTETNERAAELAIINSVQQGLAAHLDMQAMYDLVGRHAPRHLRRPGRRRSASMTWTTRRSSSRTRSNAANSLRVPPFRIWRCLRGRCCAARRRRSLTMSRPGPGERPGQRYCVRSASLPKSHVFAPLTAPAKAVRPDLAPEPRSQGRLQRGGPAAADDARRQPERRARERAARRRDTPARRRAGDRQRAWARQRRHSSTSSR